MLQCPHLDSHCPTCGQFRHLQNSIELLQQSVYELTLRVSDHQEEEEAHLPTSTDGGSPLILAVAANRAPAGECAQLRVQQAVYSEWGGQGGR